MQYCACPFYLSVIKITMCIIYWTLIKWQLYILCNPFFSSCMLCCFYLFIYVTMYGIISRHSQPMYIRHSLCTLNAEHKQMHQDLAKCLCIEVETNNIFLYATARFKRFPSKCHLEKLWSSRCIRVWFMNVFEIFALK